MFVDVGKVAGMGGGGSMRVGEARDGLGGLCCIGACVRGPDCGG